MPCGILPSAMELNSSTRVVSTKDNEASGVSSSKAKNTLAREVGLLSVEESEAAGSDVVRGHLERQLLATLRVFSKHLKRLIRGPWNTAVYVARGVF